MRTLYDRKTKMYHRPGDRLILDEVPGVYGNVPVEPGDVVLDLGGHIGTATRLFLDKGAKHVIVVEADPTNIPYLRRNLARRAVTIIPAAVGAKAGRTPFYIRSDRGYVGSVIADRDRQRIDVPMVSFAGLLKQYKPSIVKADIEFAEYGLPELRKLPNHVRVLTMEVHIRFVGIFTGRKMDSAELTQRREAAADLIAAIQAQGFRQHWRKDKQVTPKQEAGGQGPADPDETGLGPMTKCVCATWVRD